MKTAKDNTPSYGRTDNDAQIEYFENGHYLVNFSEFGKNYNHPILDKYIGSIAVATDYIHNFISKQNLGLGRSGMVCPYTSGSLKRSSLYFTIYPKNLSNKEESQKAILDYLKIFMNMEPRDDISKVFKSFMILLPEVKNEEADDVVEKLQNELKPFFTKKGLMLGQFYPGCDSQGVHNRNFRPLSSPMPLLVIRHMVKMDYVFLEGFEKDYFSNFENDFDPNAEAFFSKRKII